MEKLCTTTFIVIGNQSEVKFFHRELQKLVYSKQTQLSAVVKKFIPQWINYDTEGYFSDLSLDSTRQISFKVHTEDNPEPKLWFEICRKYQTTKCYYFSVQSNNNFYKTNDRSGKYFPARFIVIDGKGTSKKVLSLNEMYQVTADIVPIGSTFSTLEAFGKTVARYLDRIHIFDIILVDEYGKCLTPVKNMIAQYIY